MSLYVKNLCKSFPVQDGSLAVLRDCSFDLQSGGSLSVSGPSGTGKSTLLNILGTLEPATSGTVRLDDIDVLTLPERELPKFRRQKIGFVFQEHHLLPQCSALENVLMPFLAIGRLTREQTERGVALLERVGLKDRLNHRPAELSGGERHRVAIARALIYEPALILADEPTGNLDQTNAAAIGELLLEVAQSAMLILVTHSPLLAKKTKLRATLENGRIAIM